MMSVYYDQETQLRMTESELFSFSRSKTAFFGVFPHSEPALLVLRLLLRLFSSKRCLRYSEFDLFLHSLSNIFSFASLILF